MQRAFRPELFVSAGDKFAFRGGRNTQTGTSTTTIIIIIIVT